MLLKSANLIINNAHRCSPVIARMISNMQAPCLCAIIKLHLEDSCSRFVNVKMCNVWIEIPISLQVSFH